VSLEHRQHIVQLIDEARDDGARLAPACKTVDIDTASYRRWQTDGQVIADRRADAIRPEPSNKLSRQEREALLATCNRPEFQSTPPSQIVPVLADRGTYLACESTFYRVLHEARQQHDRGRAKTRHGRAKPDEFVATAPNQCWTWDVTWLKSPVLGMFYYLYMVSDLFSRKIVAWEVHGRECGELASQLIRRRVMAEGHPAGLRTLHADNGSIQKSSTLRATLERLGVEPSYSRPRVSNDNAYAESLFRTIKYRPDFPSEGFAGLESAREWVHQFVRWYNDKHCHSQLKFVTPSQRHSGVDIAVLANRHQVYQQAREANPGRWSGETRDWNRPGAVVLNQDQPNLFNDEKRLRTA